MFQQLNNLHEEHYGLWSSEYLKRRYGYVLSPQTFSLTSDMYQQLEEIGLLVARYQKGMRDLLHHVTDSNHHSDTYVRSIFNKSLAGLPLVTSDRNVPICKVDIMIGKDDRLYIAEIDGYNPRGLCYAVFLQDIQRKIGNEDKLFQGVIPKIANYLASQNETSLQWSFAHRERYYEPVFHIFARILEETAGINVRVHDLNDQTVTLNGSPNIMIPWGTSFRCEMHNRDQLVTQYQESPERFFYPLMPWMSTKGTFPLIANPFTEEGFQEHTGLFGEELYKKYIPPTVFVSRRAKPLVTQFLQTFPRVLLKKNVSSGMKGVIGRGTVEFDHMLHNALRMKKPIWTLQKCIDQQVFLLPMFNETGDTEYRDYYIRICAYVSDTGEILDAEVTGRPEPDVHGAPDCIMVPCSLPKT